MVLYLRHAVGLAGSLPSARKYVSSDQQNFDKPLKEPVVLYPQEMNVGYASLRNHFSPEDQARITHHPKPLLINFSYLMLPKSLEGSPALLERFNKRRQQYRDSGRYQRYFDDLQQGKYQAEPAALPASKQPLEP